MWGLHFFHLHSHRACGQDRQSHAFILRILIFSMVGVAAAVTEMLMNRKDQKLYHKLGFLLRIALWTPEPKSRKSGPVQLRQVVVCISTWYTVSWYIYIYVYIIIYNYMYTSDIRYPIVLYTSLSHSIGLTQYSRLPSTASCCEERLLHEIQLQTVFSWKENGLPEEWSEWPKLAMDQYLYIPFLVGWTSIYQLFWCELQGYKVLTHPQLAKYSQHWENLTNNHQTSMSYHLLCLGYRQEASMEESGAIGKTGWRPHPGFSIFSWKS